MKRRKNLRLGTVKIVLTVNIHGAQGDREIEEAAYRGLQQALREFDTALPDRVADISDIPVWRA